MVSFFLSFLIGFLMTNPALNVAGQTISLKQLGIGEPCSNRTFWSTIKLSSTDLNAARTKSINPITAWNDTIYFEYRTTGNRTNSDRMMSWRLHYLKELVLVECVWYNGTYIAKLEEYLKSLITQPSWAFSAHDTDLSYYNGRYFIEIYSAETAMNLGQIYYLLKDKLSSGLKTSLLNALEQRTFKPMRLSFQNDTWIKSKHGWETVDNNWNSVCWTGVTVAALTALSNETERNIFVQKAFEGTKYFFNAFQSDGYYSEGVGYFNYAFSNLILLRQAVMEATSGKKDFFSINANIPKYAGFAVEFPMYDPVSAQFCDDTSGDFSIGISNYLKSTFSVDPTPNYNDSLIQNNLMGYFTRIDLIENSRNRYPFATRVKYESGLRKYYDKSGILVVRPVSGDGLYASFKLLGGNLSPSGGHNHDDAGTYQIVLKGVRVAGDVGGVPYSGAWGDRYSGWTYNSFGHPVPVVCGKIQVRNWIYNLKTPKPFVVNYTTSNSVDTIVYNLNAAYNCSALISLIRRNDYTRTIGNQSVVIKDEAKYTSAQAFEASVTSRGVWNQTSISNYELKGTFTVDNVKVNVKVQTSSILKVNLTLANTNGVSYTRLGVVLPSSLSHTVTVTYT